MKSRCARPSCSSRSLVAARRPRRPRPQSPRDAAPPATPAQLKAAIDNLGKFDAPVRTAAARAVRRAPAAQAVPALIEAAGGHADGYVRFRALVLLSGFNDPRAREVMSSALDDPNDRLRTVAYAYFEHNPRARDVGAPADEAGQGRRRVRPSGADAGAGRLRRRAAGAGRAARRSSCAGRISTAAPSSRRSATIKAAYALRADHRGRQAATARSRRTPILALGKLGDKRALETLQGLQQTAPARAPAGDRRRDLPARDQLRVAPEVRRRHDDASASPTWASRISCAPPRGRSARWRRRRPAGRRGRAARRRHPGARSRPRRRSRSRSARVALRNTPLTLSVSRPQPTSSEAALLLRDAFDMLEEDFEEERFFATVRRTYWQARGRIARAQARRRADPGAGVLERGLQGSPASTSTPGTRSSGASRAWRAATFTPGVLVRDSARSAACSASARAAMARSGARRERRRRRHQAARRVHERHPRHHRRRPRQPLRQRHPRAGRAAAVLPRLPRDRPPRSRRRRADRRRARARLPRERLRAARRRDRGDARLLRRRRVRRRRLHRRRGRARPPDRRPRHRARATC